MEGEVAHEEGQGDRKNMFIYIHTVVSSYKGVAVGAPLLAVDPFLGLF